MAVRDARAQNRYEPTLLRWTPAGAGLNEDDVEELEGALLERGGAGDEREDGVGGSGTGHFVANESGEVVLFPEPAEQSLSKLAPEAAMTS